ncbi:MAG: anti-sigma factor [Leptolyngbyaceae cyanobacterium RM2_2_4]|nr:anti-sigma factor [Leptolyngbyaceae cyanobacterium SM1_4_3]NJO50785.1 anti-sigma factor [Leptolyngbyaceae cyanobacterium RM2_2_4]NJO66945.1 anti-sigma factor [Leptolyngbyaceae cyanobacterium RM1_405_57]
MIRPSLPENWEELIAGYALNDLSPEEAKLVEQLLDENPALMGEVNQLQEVLALLPYGLPRQEPPSHLRLTILEAAQEGARTPKPRRRTHRIWLELSGAVAVFVAIALGLDNYRLRQDLESADAVIQALRQPETEVYALEGTGETTAASGRLVVNPNQDQILVTVQNLPEPAAGQAYRLWGLTPGSTTPIYYGQFGTTAQGETLAQLSIPRDAIPTEEIQLLITLESSTAPLIPEGPLVMQSSL